MALYHISPHTLVRFGCALALTLLGILCNGPTVVNAAQAAELSKSAEYRLGPNDLVRIQVFGEDDLLTETKVGGDGMIVMPLLGKLSVQGLTSHDVQETITAGLKKGFLRDPKVTVSVMRMRNVFITGEVRTPGAFPYEDGLSAQTGIALAGGFTERANRQDLMVTRTVRGVSRTIPITANEPLLPDDALTVKLAQRVFTTGEVRTPGPYPFESGITAHRVISLSGGYTDKADQSSLAILRVTERGIQTLPVLGDALLQPDDILVVETQRHKIYVSGEVRSPGGFPYQQGVTVHQAIALAGGLTEKADQRRVLVSRSVKGERQSSPVPLDRLLQPDDLIIVEEIKKIYVTGEVKSPGPYLMEAGMTVQRAISLAGGVTEKADPQSLKLTRLTPTGVDTRAVAREALLTADDIVVVEAQYHKFYVSGEVKASGAYPFKEGLDVQKAVAMAGGSTEKADRLSYRIERFQQGRRHVLLAQPTTPLLPEDLLLVPEGKKYYVSGEVKVPGPLFFDGQPVTVQKAITMAGGMTERADRWDVLISRSVDGIVQQIPAEVTALVEPDDFIIVGKLQRVFVDGEVRKPGDYEFEKNLTVHKAIAMAGGFTDKAAESRVKILRQLHGKQYAIKAPLDEPLLPDDIIMVPQSLF